MPVKHYCAHKDVKQARPANRFPPLFGVSRICALLVYFCFFGLRTYPALSPLLTNTVHLGRAGESEWQIFEDKKPDAEKLALTFSAKTNEAEFTLLIRQDDVKLDWTVTLNGKKLGSLFLMEADLVHALPIPPGSLRSGTNELRITGNAADDILVHEILIGDAPKSKLLASKPINITVRDPMQQDPLPCRITIVDERGSLAEIVEAGSTNLAIRPGVIYTGTGKARVRLLPGRYTIYVTRGPEYGLGQAKIVADEAERYLELTIRREMNTDGWIASDTHIHTFHFSRHGDALLDERIITLAGEALDLPITTEHNLHSDYLPAARALGLDKYFTSVHGNEVTTRKGHFNIFPVSLAAKPPDHQIEHWPDLLARIRSTPDVQIAILNHPTDTHSGFTPFAITNLHPLSGRNLRGNFEFTFDAMEVINSGAMRSDWMEPFRAWMALLNYGCRITAVGSSDSHDVSRFIVGQGRTYIRGDDSDPARIDIQKACDSLKRGRAVVSLGLLVQLNIKNVLPFADSSIGATGAGPSGPGDLHSANGKEIEIFGTLDYPHWEWPEQLSRRTEIRIYANGQSQIPVIFNELPPHERKFRRKLLKPSQDTYFVAIASAPGVTAPYWALARPYQPTSKAWDPVMLGATNPIWVDADGDGRFTSPREYASRIIAKHQDKPGAMIDELAEYDWATAVQVADLLSIKGADLEGSSFQALLERAAPQTKSGFNDYLKEGK
jgi:hypothetical protein